jgi:hypothetical protein
MPDFPPGFTLGFEIETEEMNPSDIYPGKLGFGNVHDASIETPIYRMDGLKVDDVFLKTVPSSGNGHRGVEYTSMVFNVEEGSPYTSLCKLTKYLTENGESFQSDRAGIHIHVGMGRSVSLSTLKTILRWSMYLEDLFFRLGGNGYRFRGEENSSAFCRPITKFGPPCVPYKNGWALCYDVNHLLEATSSRQFWNLYFGTNFDSPPRYVPQRYSWMNFYSIPAHGTIEVRVFNKTLNPMFIMAEAELFQRMVVHCLGNTSPPPEVHSVYESRNTEELLNVIDFLYQEFDLLVKTREILKQIVKTTPSVNLNPEPIVTHLIDSQRFGNPWSETSYTPTIVTNPGRANVVTIHNLSSSRRLRSLPSVPSIARLRFNPETGSIEDGDVNPVTELPEFNEEDPR